MSCHFGILWGNIEKFELSIILLHMGLLGHLKMGHTFRTRYNNKMFVIYMSVVNSFRSELDIVSVYTR